MKFSHRRGRRVYVADRTSRRRADTKWEESGLKRITPLECGYTFASLMIAAGANAKAPSTFMGHSDISITLDRYGHPMPGSEAEASALLHTCLAAQRERAVLQAHTAKAAVA